MQKKMEQIRNELCVYVFMGVFINSIFEVNSIEWQTK